MGKSGRSLRTITFDDYGISEERYQELKHFCRQYKDKKRKAKTLGNYELHGANLDKSGGGSGNISKPTESAALRNYERAERMLKECRMIEEAALWAAEVAGYRSMWRALLYGVTEGAGYDRLLVKYPDIPFGVSDFYAIRRVMFYRLDRLQHDEADGDDALL